MNTRQKLHQARLQEWAIRFTEQKTSGLTVRLWCEQNNLSIHAYNYWKHLLKEEVLGQALPDIVPVTIPIISSSGTSIETTESAIRANRTNGTIRTNVSDIAMQINGVTINIDASVPETFLCKLVKAVCHA